VCKTPIHASNIVIPYMDVKDILTGCQEVLGDSKDTTTKTEYVTEDNRDVPVKTEVESTDQLDYYVVNHGASGMSVEIKARDIKLEDVEQTYCDSKMAPMADVPVTDRPHAVLLVQVKHELDDVDSICTESSTTVHSDIHVSGCAMLSAVKNMQYIR
jgi:hypothetical protein